MNLRGLSVDDKVVQING